ARLVDELRQMNHIVARFAGVLSDRLGQAHEIDAAIFAHPRFERLEMGAGEGDGDSEDREREIG
ncbi:MAG TPA: hypothetical protein VGM50_05345, partial [Gemmatimonadaceae bacterium]